jgi:hypothetical protein
MPLVEWAASYLPDSITEHLEFEPGAAPAEDGDQSAGEQAASDAETERT